MKMRLLLLLLTTLPVASAVAQTSSGPAWPRLQPQVFVDLTYPIDALDARLVGPVVVQVTTDATGRVAAAEALAGPAPLAVPAVENARRWTLTPGARIGVLVYRFEMPGGLCNDDSRSLFRLAKPNLAVITACTGTSRTTYPSGAVRDVEFVSYGDRPRYPDLAQSAQITGVVVIEMSVDRTGRIVESKPLTNLPFLTDAAVAHSRTWRAGAAAADRRILVVYEFALDNPVCDNQRQTVFRQIARNYMKLSGCSPLIDF